MVELFSRNLREMNDSATFQRKLLKGKLLKENRLCRFFCAIFCGNSFFRCRRPFSGKNASHPYPWRYGNGFQIIHPAPGLDCEESRLIVKNR